MPKLKMMHPDGGSASWRGDTYEAVDGEITVPFDAAEDLMSHGFEPTGQVDDEPVEEPAAKKARASA